MKFCLLVGGSKILSTVKTEIGGLLEDLVIELAENWIQSSKNFLLYFCGKSESSLVL